MIQPTKRILDFPLLNALEHRQQLDTHGTRFIIFRTLIGEFSPSTFHRDGFDRDERGGGSGGHDFGKVGKFVVGDWAGFDFPAEGAGGDGADGVGCYAFDDVFAIGDDDCDEW